MVTDIGFNFGLLLQRKFFGSASMWSCLLLQSVKLVELVMILFLFLTAHAFSGVAKIAELGRASRGQGFSSGGQAYTRDPKRRRHIAIIGKAVHSFADNGDMSTALRVSRVCLPP